MIIAFYAPMKSPFHPVPSGDRRTARLLMKALEAAGYELEYASNLRTFDKVGDVDFQKDVREQSILEAERLIADYRNRPIEERPDAWFSYHLYHKAPDWIGPLVCEALDLPYFVAEASHAPKRKTSSWALGFAAAEKAIFKARKVFNMTRLDGECLKQIVGSPDALVYLPPFLEAQTSHSDASRAEEIIAKSGGRLNVLSLLCVGMMREGDKLESYRQLSEALGHLKGEDWQLIIVGDGDERQRVEGYMRAYSDRVLFVGERGVEDLDSLYHYADLYVWPAHGEAYGMAFLEAGFCGLPIVAGNIRGVPDVVLEDQTGLLCRAGDMPAFASSIRYLLDNPEERQAMSERAHQFVAEERNLQKASDILSRHIEMVV